MGTQTLSGVGASFVGSGGSCSDIISSPTYGNYSSVPNFANLTQIQNQIGSMGNVSTNLTAGGGRIVIIADSLVLNGTGAQIQANAKPYFNTTSLSNLAGGSGGYVYIKTTNIVAGNLIINNAAIQA